MKVGQKAPRAGSQGEKVLTLHEKHPNWDTQRLADKVGCTTRYVSSVLAKYTDQVAKPVKAAKKQVKKKKPVTDETPKNQPASDPGKLPLVDPDGKMRGGNSNIDYSIDLKKTEGDPPQGASGMKQKADGVRTHSGKIDGLDGMTMALTIIDGKAAANIREAQAYVASIRAVMEGLETLEKMLEDPKTIGHATLQIQNMLNASKRIAAKMLETHLKRKSSTWESEAHAQTQRVEYKIDARYTELSKEEAVEFSKKKDAEAAAAEAAKKEPVAAGS